MTFNFTVKEFILGNGAGTPTFQFYKRGFNLQGNGSTPSWQDIILSGNGSLTLTNAKANGLNYLKLFGGTEQRNLPEGYTQVEYIESDGAQYIRTNVNIKNTSKIKLVAQPSNTNSKALIGSNVNGSAPSLSIVCSGQFFWGSSSPSFTPDTNKHTYYIDTNKLYIDDVLKATSTGTWSDSAVIPSLGLLTVDQGTSALEGYIASAKVYSLQIWDGDTLVFNGIPAKDSSNVLGMYDTVTGNFLTNAGSGSFTAGAETVPTPTTPVNIVCNNGVLEYRDTELPKGYKRILGMTMNNDCFYQTSVYPTGADTLKFSYEWTSTTACNVLGCYTTSSAQDNLSLYIGSNQTAKYLRYNGGTASSYSLDNKRYNVQITPTGSIGMEIEDTWEQKDFTCSVPLCIGITGASATSAKFIGNLYENVEIVGKVKFIPCERLSDNEIGYYDTLNETFIEPTGTTPTSLGYDNTHNIIYTDGTTETVEIHGKNLFDKSDNSQYIGAYVNSNTGVLTTYSLGYCFCVPCKPNTTYTLSGMTGNSTWGSFTSNEIGTTATTKVLSNGTLTTGANDKYLIGIVYTTTTNPVDYRNTIQIELGSTATTYEPYFNGGSATAEMLLKVGDYQDIQSVLDGEVTRNVGIKVIDGTEGWFIDGGCFRYAISDKPLGKIFMYCTHFEYTTATTANTQNGQFGAPSANNSLYFKATDYADVSAWTTFLTQQYNAGTPVIIVYPLATATTESVESQALTIQAGTNIVEITQGSIDNLPLEVSYKATV